MAKSDTEEDIPSETAFRYIEVESKQCITLQSLIPQPQAENHDQLITTLNEILDYVSDLLNMALSELDREFEDSTEYMVHCSTASHSVSPTSLERKFFDSEFNTVWHSNATKPNWPEVFDIIQAVAHQALVEFGAELVKSLEGEALARLFMDLERDMLEAEDQTNSRQVRWTTKTSTALKQGIYQALGYRRPTDDEFARAERMAQAGHTVNMRKIITGQDEDDFEPSWFKVRTILMLVEHVHLLEGNEFSGAPRSPLWPGMYVVLDRSTKVPVVYNTSTRKE